MRKLIFLTADLSDRYELSDWRQSKYNVNHTKRLMRTAQNKKRYRGKTEEQQQECEKQIKKAHREYINVARNYLTKACATVKALETSGLRDISDSLLIENINHFVAHAERQINQIDRRVLRGETIPHHEKVFSIFEPHTEWVCKGKAGVPVELGLRVCVMEDQYQFILHHEVMEKQTDDQLAIPMVQKSKQRFPDLKITSFDKGFHSPENQKFLNEVLDVVALPRKGRLSRQAQAIEASEEFRNARRKHSAVESAINALEVHGLDRCPDHGIYGFKRYIALAVVARNVHRIGAILKNHTQKTENRKRKKYINRDDVEIAA